ncbi:hypothetical protein ACSZMF_21855 [Aeromonas caviae]|uniref:hypothetical protein n=1 Tax=Aeromonas caviae TaxID=648 RepID=UPI003EC85208
MTPANYELPKTSDSKYPWKDKFNRLKATEEMIRFAGYILHQLQVDTINIDSDSILLTFNDYLNRHSAPDLGINLPIALTQYLQNDLLVSC